VRDEEHHDVVIVGAGVAGVSCALECFDIQLDTVVCESTHEPGGQVAEIPHSVRNVAVGRFENGRALRQTLEDSSAILTFGRATRGRWCRRHRDHASTRGRSEFPR